mgnify:CR=1 FL=1
MLKESIHWFHYKDEPALGDKEEELTLHERVYHSNHLHITPSHMKECHEGTEMPQM